jgi:rhamnulokinase
MAKTRLAALDLGASSGRVFTAEVDPAGQIRLDEAYRFANTPRRASGHLRWNFGAIADGVLAGLGAAAAAGPLDAVSVDGWAVDYGLLDDDGNLLADPVHYRDDRTAGPLREILRGRAAMGPRELYAITGVPSQGMNTLFQLMAEQGSAGLAAARHVVLVPDLVTYLMSGSLGTELTNASTTQLLDPGTMTWSPAIAEALGVPIGLFPPLRTAGTIAGPLLDSVAGRAGVSSRPLVVVGPSHDTAAAVAGVPAAEEAFAYVCTGTWALVGVELSQPVRTEAARQAGFTNEVGVDGTIRFLRNVTGFWLLQQAAEDWRSGGMHVDLDALTEAAADVPPLRAVFDVQDPRLAAPGGMATRITAACRRATGSEPTSPAEMLRAIVDSMALAIRRAVRAAGRLSGREVRIVHLVGGGVANPLFCQSVADACGLPVLAGPTEAACWGSVLVQARALGAVSCSLAEFRAIIRESAACAEYRPWDTAAWDEAEKILPDTGAAS